MSRRGSLRALRARSVPVVARGTRFGLGQVIRDVADFLGTADLDGLPLTGRVWY